MGSKRRPARPRRDARVFGNHTRPASGQRCQVPQAVAIEDALFTPARFMKHEVEIHPEERMKRVRHPDRSGQLVGGSCSSLGG